MTQTQSDAATQSEEATPSAGSAQSHSPMPQLHPVFAKQIECLMKNDFDALLETFHPEIVSLQFQGPIYGREGARALLRKYEGLDMEFVGIEEYVHGDDMILTRTKMRVKGEEFVAFGAYVIRDGMIWRQFGCDEGGVRDWWGTDGVGASQ